MKNVIYSKFSVKNEEDLMLIIDDSKYAIDDSNYSGSTSFSKYIILDEQIRPTIINKFNRNVDEKKKLFRLFYKYSGLGYSDRGHIEELYNHENYVVKRASWEEKE